VNCFVTFVSIALGNGSGLDQFDSALIQ